MRTAIRGSHVSPVLVFSFRGGHFHGRRRDPARGLTPPDRTFRTRQPGKSCRGRPVQSFQPGEPGGGAPVPGSEALAEPRRISAEPATLISVQVSNSKPIRDPPAPAAIAVLTPVWHSLGTYEGNEVPVSADIGTITDGPITRPRARPLRQSCTANAAGARPCARDSRRLLWRRSAAACRPH